MTLAVVGVRDEKLPIKIGIGIPQKSLEICKPTYKNMVVGWTSRKNEIIMDQNMDQHETI